MSRAASDYNIKYMSLGIALSVVSFVLILPSVAYTLGLQSRERFLILSITVLYSIMMFASSYVEEEQNFWYWCLSAWILYLYFYRLVKPELRKRYIK